MICAKKMKKQESPIPKAFYSEGGIVEFVEMLDSNAGRSSAYSQSHYLLKDDDEKTNVAVEVALTYNDSYNEHIYLLRK